MSSNPQAEGYSFVKGGKLKLKNETSSKHKKHKKSKKRKSSVERDPKFEDELAHGGNFFELYVIYLYFKILIIIMM